MFMNPLNTTRASTLLADLAPRCRPDVGVNRDTTNTIKPNPMTHTINHTKTDKESIT